MRKIEEWQAERSFFAFSLVEVTVALGIASFCLIAIVGLLPVGLNSVSNAREEAAAAVVMEQMASAIRNASSVGAANAGSYVALAPYTNLVWTNGGPSLTMNFTDLSRGGVPGAQGVNQRLRACVQITPASSLTAASSALVSIAWPVQAQWNPASNTWSNAQGSVSTWLIFLPRQ